MDRGHVSDISMTEVNKELVALIKEKLEAISSLKSIFRVPVKLLQANQKVYVLTKVSKVNFTGSMEVGREIMHAAASSNLKQVSLELVEKSPLLIFYDADVDKADSLALLGIVYNKGEICVASSRVFVQEGNMDLGILFFLFHTLQVLTATRIRYWRNAIDSSLFKQWLHNLQSEIGILADGTLALRQVLIQGVDMFGKCIGFLKFKADIYKPVPGIAFARGPAVTVLILLESDGETYAVLTEQARVPTGRIILELPAGMLDDDKGDFVGTAVRESSLSLSLYNSLHGLVVEEETGIKFKLEDMVDLTTFLDSSTGCRFFPSPTVDYKRPTYEEVMRTSKPYFQGSAISAKFKSAKL
ncbi:hypothetical protein Ahy_B08g092877 [Arachis hypogaea]|uniref:Aldehyde dehydrogenase domain-containing protein n=1 Tax=Arachis hypogaea TaxID=3818 RepID=A0A444Y4T6_ARAHY|nr:hypothetical protein Ahy_B08g092877 [Arachis hypogaea]